MSDVNLSEMRQHYRAALIDSEEQAQRLLSLGVAAAAAVLVMSAPALSLNPALHAVWVGLCAAFATGGMLMRRRLFSQLRETLFEQQLMMHTAVDMPLWHRIGKMRALPQPLNSYVEYILSTYRDFKSRVNEEADIELGQVQLHQAREQVLDYIDLAERTGAIREVLETQSHRLSDEDQIRLRQKFSEQCAGLQQIAQSFDRSLGNLVVAQVLGDELGETTIEDVAVRMREMEDEFDQVKQGLRVTEA